MSIAPPWGLRQTELLKRSREETEKTRLEIEPTRRPPEADHRGETRRPARIEQNKTRAGGSLQVKALGDLRLHALESRLTGRERKRVTQLSFEKKNYKKGLRGKSKQRSGKERSVDRPFRRMRRRGGGNGSKDRSGCRNRYLGEGHFGSEEIRASREKDTTGRTG